MKAKPTNREKRVKAWARICIHCGFIEAQEYKEAIRNDTHHPEYIVPCTITYSLPTKHVKRKKT